MKHDIKFYVPEGEKLPTKLRIMADGNIFISYEREHSVFGYTFEFHTPTTEELADEIMEDIIWILINQSYDHGARWVKTYQTRLEDDLEGMKFYKYICQFRIRDAG